MLNHQSESILPCVLLLRGESNKSCVIDLKEEIEFEFEFDFS